MHPASCCICRNVPPKCVGDSQRAHTREVAGGCLCIPALQAGARQYRPQQERLQHLSFKIKIVIRKAFNSCHPNSSRPNSCSVLHPDTYALAARAARVPGCCPHFLTQPIHIFPHPALPTCSCSAICMSAPTCIEGCGRGTPAAMPAAFAPPPLSASASSGCTMRSRVCKSAGKGVGMREGSMRAHDSEHGAPSVAATPPTPSLGSK